jgi:long-subunit acyl-CoA synthetase (AMP-forming)
MTSFESNSRVALQLDNSSKWLKVDKLLSQHQSIIVPIPHFFSTKQIHHMILVVGIDKVVCEKAAEQFWITQGFVFCTVLYDGIIVLEKNRTHYPTLPKHTHKITFTSGTTSEPKGVCLSQKHLDKVGESLAQITQQFAVAKHMCLLPLSVLLENVAAHYAAKYINIEVVTPSLRELGLAGSSSLDIKKLVDSLLKYQPDSIIVMPQILKAIIYMCEHHDLKLPFLKFVAVGGAVCSKGLLKKAQRFNLPVYEGYGISECGSVISLNTSKEACGSVGKVLPHQRVKLAQDGEILTQGELFLGYIGQDIEPKEWYATGDLGQFDKRGNLTIVGRKKNTIINSFGRNISPDWIEAELLANDAITQVAIYGEAQPFLTAICFSHHQRKTIKQMIDEINQTLPDYAQVKAIILTSEAFTLQNQMLTASGKTKHQTIFKQYKKQLENIYANTVTTKANAI